MGRLLIEKETWAQNAGGKPSERNNCCVTFSDASSAFESEIATGHNCCVSFRGRRDPRSEERRRKQVGVIFVLLIIAATVVGVAAVTHQTRGDGNTDGMN